jgi:dihydrofolate synthase/folylpolyglutamate synthase
MALEVFAEERVDVVVLEVGLGGRLDATNAIVPDLAVIAPVDFDHEAFLGKSLESIAGEKAGILKPGVPAVFARQRPEAAGVLADRAASLGVAVSRTEEWPVRELELDARGSRFLLGDLHLHCPLAGAHQVENAVTAAVALLQLGVSKSAIESGIGKTSWPGRMERVSESPEIILDGAHNPAGARALAAHIERFYSGRRVRLIYGAMRDKAIAEISGILFPLAEQVIVTAPRQARALAPDTMRQISDHANLTVAPGIEAALAMVAGAAREEVIFVTGSLFLVAEARAAIIGSKR